MWPPFNKREYSVSLSMNNDSFAAAIGTGLVATPPSESVLASHPKKSKPMYYPSGKHWQLTSSPATIESYSKQLANRLSACRKIAELLVREHCEWHRALINSRRQDPRVYSQGDIVFARRATRSDASRERVGKLEYKFTEPWQIVASLHGGSYSLEHCLHPKRTKKKHASDLTPYPSELIITLLEPTPSRRQV